MQKETTISSNRESVIYCTWEVLLKELDNIGIGGELTEWQLRTLKKGLFAARTPRDIKPHKLVKDGQGDWVLMNDTLLKVRYEFQHMTASRVDVSNATKLAHLKEWANAAEQLVKVFKAPRPETYHRFCQIAISLMGSNYGLNNVSRYVDKINTQFEIEKICVENVNDPQVVSVLRHYVEHYNLSAKFKHEIKQAHNFIHFIRLVNTAKQYGIEPLNWIKTQIEEEAKLGRNLNMAFSYNAVAVDRMSKLVNSLGGATSNASNEDAFLNALNAHVSLKKR